MSYTFNGIGGTNHGTKSYNEIFALNSGTVGSSNYWNPDLQDGDTVLMYLSYTHDGSLMYNYKLLYYHDYGGLYGSHWAGTGLYLCYNNDNTTINPGDFVCQWSGGTVPNSTTLPIIVEASSAGEALQPMGVALESASAGNYILVAMMGLWPIKRAEASQAFDVAIYSTFNGSGSATITGPGDVSYKAGAFGKCIDDDFPIIGSTGATPLTSNGGLYCIWGTSAETY